MADRLKGITLEIGGDTTKLSKALSGVNSDIINTKSALKDVERLLKLDPGNVELLRQKQQLLTGEITATTEKLDKLKQAQQTMDTSGVDQNSAQYMALQREIIATEQELGKLEDASDQANSALSKIGETADKVASGASTGTLKRSTRSAGGAASMRRSTSTRLHTRSTKSRITLSVWSGMEFPGSTLFSLTTSAQRTMNTTAPSAGSRSRRR